MKKITTSIFIVVAIVSLFAISACNNEPITVQYNIPDKEICVPANPYNTYQSFTYTLSKSDINAALTAAQIKDLSRVMSAGLKEGFKAVVSVSGVNLDDISNIEVYMKQSGASGDGDMVAYSDVKAAGASEVKLRIYGRDLKQAVSTDMDFTVKVLSGSTGSTAKCIKLTTGVLEIKVKQ